MKYVFLMLNLLKIRIVLSFEIMCSHDFGDKKYYCIISFLKSIVIAGRCFFFNYYCYYYHFIGFIAVTLVHKTIWFSNVQLNETSSAHWWRWAKKGEWGQKETLGRWAHNVGSLVFLVYFHVNVLLSNSTSNLSFKKIGPWNSQALVPWG